jgi:Ino eighty subunit 2
MLNLPTQTQKPTRVRRAVHKDKSLDSDVESEDSDGDYPRSTDGKKPLTTRQAVLASVVGSLHISLGASLRLQDTARFSCIWVFLTGHRGIDETSRKTKQLNEAEIALRREETARK